MIGAICNEALEPLSCSVIKSDKHERGASLCNSRERENQDFQAGMEAERRP
jgi:hypothetical protein